MTIKEKLPVDTPRVEIRKPLTVAGLRRRYNAKTVTNIPSLWRELQPYWAKRNGANRQSGIWADLRHEQRGRL